MNHLLANTKGKNGALFKVISNKSIFEMPTDLDNPVAYTTDYKLEEDEWFGISKFSEQEYCIDLLTKKFISTDYNQLARADFAKIDYLCAYQSGIYYFQKLSSSQIIRKKYFSISDEPVLKEDEPIIVLNQVPDAVYNSNNDTLYFKRLTPIATIFKGIYELYKEATQEETDNFLENDFIQLDNDFSSGKVKKANRKRIAMAMETLQKFTIPQKRQIFKYIKGYCVELKFDVKAKNFSISTEEELKKLLYGIEQRYYTTKFGGEKRLANSITALL